VKAHKYELTDDVAGFDEGAILDVTARFGDWHRYQLKLEPEAAIPAAPTLVVSEEPGFSEADILDPTARIGDWHEYALKFDPTADDEDADNGRVAITKETFDRITNPIDSAV
jgi:hypothetical protein